MTNTGYIEKLPNELLVEMIKANLDRLEVLNEKGKETSFEYKICREYLSKLQGEAEVRGIDAVRQS